MFIPVLCLCAMTSLLRWINLSRLCQRSVKQIWRLHSRPEWLFSQAILAQVYTVLYNVCVCVSLCCVQYSVNQLVSIHLAWLCYNYVLPGVHEYMYSWCYLKQLEYDSFYPQTRYWSLLFLEWAVAVTLNQSMPSNKLPAIVAST